MFGLLVLHWFTLSWFWNRLVLDSLGFNSLVLSFFMLDCLRLVLKCFCWFMFGCFMLDFMFYCFVLNSMFCFMLNSLFMLFSWFMLNMFSLWMILCSFLDFSLDLFLLSIFISVLFVGLLFKLFGNISHGCPFLSVLFLLSSHFDKEPSCQYLFIEWVFDEINGIDSCLKDYFEWSRIVFFDLDEVNIRECFFNILLNCVEIAFDKVKGYVFNILG